MTLYSQNKQNEMVVAKMSRFFNKFGDVLFTAKDIIYVGGSERAYVEDGCVDYYRTILEMEKKGLVSLVEKPNVIPPDGHHKFKVNVEVFQNLLGKPIPNVIDAGIIFTEYRTYVDVNILKFNTNLQSTFAQIEKDLFEQDSSEAYSNIANTIRSAVIEFAKSVWNEFYLPAGVEPPKADDAKSKFKYVVRAKQEGNDEALESLIAANWRYINHIVHKKNTSEADAKRCYINAYLLMGDIARLIS